MRACWRPQYSAHWPRWMPGRSAWSHVSVVRPGIMSILPWSAGTQKLWMTSREVSRTRTRRPGGNVHLVGGRHRVVVAGAGIADLPPPLMPGHFDHELVGPRPRQDRRQIPEGHGGEDGADDRRHHDAAPQTTAASARRSDAGVDGGRARRDRQHRDAQEREDGHVHEPEHRRRASRRAPPGDSRPGPPGPAWTVGPRTQRKPAISAGRCAAPLYGRCRPRLRLASASCHAPRHVRIELPRRPCAASPEPETLPRSLAARPEPRRPSPGQQCATDADVRATRRPTRCPCFAAPTGMRAATARRR